MFILFSKYIPIRIRLLLIKPISNIIILTRLGNKNPSRIVIRYRLAQEIFILYAGHRVMNILRNSKKI